MADSSGWMKWSFLLVLRAFLRSAWPFVGPSPTHLWGDVCCGPWPCLLLPTPCPCPVPSLPSFWTSTGRAPTAPCVPESHPSAIVSSWHPSSRKYLFLYTQSLSVSSSDTLLHRRLDLFVFPWEQRPSFAHLSSLPSRSCFLNSVPWIVAF